MKKMVLLLLLLFAISFSTFYAGAVEIINLSSWQWLGVQETSADTGGSIQEELMAGSDTTEQISQADPDANEEQESYLERTVDTGPDGKKIVNNPGDILVLVNKERNLPADYIPENLVKPDIPFPFREDLPKKLLREEAARAIEALFAKAAADGLRLYGLSGYRSYERQEQIFTYKARKRGEEVANRTSARPGQSEHQTGLAMDVTSPGVNYRLNQSFGETKEGKWLVENAPDFGFIIRYPKGKEEITGYSYEPWHLRYVGVEAAREIAKLGITLEEYLRDHY